MWSLPLLFVVARLWGNVAIDAMVSAPTLDAGQVALASFLTVAGWVLLVLSLLAGGAAVFLGRRPSKRARGQAAKPALRRLGKIGTGIGPGLVRAGPEGLAHRTLVPDALGHRPGRPQPGRW